jgi:hypothetical protein
MGQSRHFAPRQSPAGSTVNSATRRARPRVDLGTERYRPKTFVVWNSSWRNWWARTIFGQPRTVTPASSWQNTRSRFAELPHIENKQFRRKEPVLNAPNVAHLVVAQIYDLAALTMGATRDAAVMPRCVSQNPSPLPPRRAVTQQPHNVLATCGLVTAV